MCGICGVAAGREGGVPATPILERMAASIAHRGPDDCGLYVHPLVGLGHRRLSIVDLAGGRQPMGNEDESIRICYNGEIYNHADLRASLLARGHRYRTASDTETILHLYEDRGLSGFAELQGMFAFALWDGRQETLVLARDHSGIKPLYYAEAESGELLFASEPKAIFASRLVAPELEPQVVAEFFAAGHVSGERTLLRGIRKLLPGTWLRWHRGRLETGRFWSLQRAAAACGEAIPGTLTDAATEFWDRFQASVQSQLMSDVPLGAFLSGGLDSSLLVAATHALGIRNLNTFSVGYDDRGTSELPAAARIAKAFATRHHEVLQTPEQFFADLPRLTAHRDFPLVFSASIPLARVAAAACPQVKVVLTGEGSDELFAGYGRYPRALFNLRWGRRFERWTPAFSRRSLRTIIGRLGDDYVSSRIRRSFLGLEASPTGVFLEPFADFGAQARHRLLDDPDGALIGPATLLDTTLFAENPLEALLRLDQETYLEELLMKQDTMSMAASIESRVPFLDHTLRIWSARLPPAFKLRGWSGKALVRAAAQRHLPPAIGQGRKRGFPVPLARWFRLPIGRDILHTYALQDMRDAGLRRDYPHQLAEEHARGHDRSARLWRLTAFGVWLREVVPRLGKACAG